jgi:hypothetical protein
MTQRPNFANGAVRRRCQQWSEVAFMLFSFFLTSHISHPTSLNCNTDQKLPVVQQKFICFHPAGERPVCCNLQMCCALTNGFKFLRVQQTNFFIVGSFKMMHPWIFTDAEIKFCELFKRICYSIFELRFIKSG